MRKKITRFWEGRDFLFVSAPRQGDNPPADDAQTWRFSTAIAAEEASAQAAKESAETPPREKILQHGFDRRQKRRGAARDNHPKRR
jgi:hypothetical protein